MQTADCKNVTGRVVIEFFQNVLIYFGLVTKYNTAYESLRITVKSIDKSLPVIKKNVRRKLKDDTGFFDD